ncbi:hypothetical protein [Salipiger sp. PrR003]|uniref:hypothetical protein n=1 Tax=Salipiger sp. PrR003 TaxID=2706776 RepID=UPI0013DA3407|nr:hypothetical protein [Salipiger sp. PrR003]NDV51547.1 hypothetical protein [Salipiger sp. PrR003]
MALPTLEEIFASDTAGILRREPAAARPKVSSAEERILQIMEDVNAFHAEHGRLPDADATDRDERGRARRLRSAESENAELLKTVDRCGYFSESADVPVDDDDDLPSMDEIMASSLITDNNIYAIQDRGQAPQTRVANEEPARRQPCDDFDRFRPAFNACHVAVDAGDARYVEFRYGGKIKEGDF